MPRGRPPIQRTKEEANIARRAQVRRNVQAYRRRKHCGSGSEAPQTPPKKPFTFVFEQWGEQDSPPLLRTELDAPLEHQCDITKRDRGRRLLHHSDGITASCKMNRATTMLKCSAEIPPEINAARVSRQQFTSHAATAFLPMQQNRRGVFSETGPHWVQLIPDLVNRYDVLDSSIQALCLMQISYVKQERWLFRSSLTFYDSALQALRGALAQPNKAFRIEIFAAAMALATYELLQGIDASESRGWMYHIEGASSYLNAFPELDVCSFSHQISFHFLETVCIFDALGARKPSCFSTSKWWRSTVDRFGDHIYGSLLRMITSLPTILQRCDESMALAASVEAYERRSTLLQMAFCIERAFLDWIETTMAQLSLSQPPLVSTIQESCDSHAETAQPEISFPNIYTARLFLLYWSSMILLYESIADLLRSIESCSEFADLDASFRCDLLDNAFTLEKYMEISHNFATKIRQSVRFCLQPEIGVIGKTLILLPLWIARNHFAKRDDGQARWCSALLDQLGQSNLTFGLRVRKSISRSVLR
ncbi:hypothetical protein IMSHALPRED_003394 [Imshaugia aleurites]|uniref:Uncharacterized protein n=1 Tax=Imshaugia aleurites TaxID=172621 RepID=A0A8H3PII4_9LECA|nr:hypothetical protein IMSHALPRED_003394 [Imshaugia aleurites]